LLSTASRMKDDVFNGGGGFVGSDSDSDSGESRFVILCSGVVSTDGALARYIK